MLQHNFATSYQLSAPSGGGSDFGAKVVIGPQRPAEERGQPFDIAGLRDHPVAQESLAHPAHVEGQSVGHELPEALLKCDGVFPTTENGAPQHLRSHTSYINAGQRAGSTRLMRSSGSGPVAFSRRMSSMAVISPTLRAPIMARAFPHYAGLSGSTFSESPCTTSVPAGRLVFAGSRVSASTLAPRFASCRTT